MLIHRDVCAQAEGLNLPSHRESLVRDLQWVFLDVPPVPRGKPGPDNSPELLTQGVGTGCVKGSARKVPALIIPKQVCSLLRDKVMLSPVRARDRE